MFDKSLNCLAFLLKLNAIDMHQSIDKKSLSDGDFSLF